MKEPDRHRRRFLRTLLGADFRERLARERLAEEVCWLIQERSFDLAFGAAESELPAPKKEILETLRTTAASKRPTVSRAALREAYASIAMFCDEKTLGVIRAAKADLDSQNFGEEGQRRIQAGFALRTTLVQERIRLEKEFDAFVRDHSGQDSEDRSDE